METKKLPAGLSSWGIRFVFTFTETGHLKLCSIDVSHESGSGDMDRESQGERFHNFLKSEVSCIRTSAMFIRECGLGY
jgi:hypothetical protein